MFLRDKQTTSMLPFLLSIEASHCLGEFLNPTCSMANSIEFVAGSLFDKLRLVIAFTSTACKTAFIDATRTDLCAFVVSRP
eukprot:SAG31_NODE_9391_length_1282_cov_1.196459_2_plen_81_part_00